MKIGIIGVNKISKFYAIILAQLKHQVIMYENPSPINNFTVDKIILEENFFNSFIKPLAIFKKLETNKIDINVIEKHFFKEVSLKENFIELKNYEYTDDFQFEKIPNLEIVPLNSTSVNQIKLMEDILILDTPDYNILEQLDLVKLNNWIAIYIESEKNDNNFQITKEGKYSIFSINEENKKTIFINTKERNKKEVMKIIKNKIGNYRVVDEQSISKYDSYAYKNIAIINTALVEYNYPYRDYSLLVQIIENTEAKKIFSNLDIYSDIKSQVI